jgi:hypothetical protein
MVPRVCERRSTIGKKNGNRNFNNHLSSVDDFVAVKALSSNATQQNSDRVRNECKINHLKSPNSWRFQQGLESGSGTRGRGSDTRFLYFSG